MTSFHLAWAMQPGEAWHCILVDMVSKFSVTAMHVASRQGFGCSFGCEIFWFGVRNTSDQFTAPNLLKDIFALEMRWHGYCSWRPSFPKSIKCFIGTMSCISDTVLVFIIQNWEWDRASTRCGGVFLSRAHNLFKSTTDILDSTSYSKIHKRIHYLDHERSHAIPLPRRFP